MEYIGKYITHPAIFKKQDDIINRELAGGIQLLQSTSLDSNDEEIIDEYDEDNEDDNNATDDNDNMIQKSVKRKVNVYNNFSNHRKNIIHILLRCIIIVQI
jgi:hypothetical protein